MMKQNDHLVKGGLFFLVAFSFSGALLGFQELLWIPGELQLPMYGPALAALLFLWRKQESVAGFLGRSFTFKFTKGALAGLLIPVVVTGCISYWTQISWGVANVIDLSVNIAPAILYVVAMFFAVIGEELGWRGYLLPKLQEKYTPLIASLVVGVIWGIWHTPTKLLGTTFFVFWFLQLQGVNFLFTRLYNQTRPSLWSVILLHYILNVMGFLFIQKPVETIVLSGLGYLLVGGLVLMVDWKAFSKPPVHNL